MHSDFATHSALSLLWTAAALLPLRQPLTVIVVGVDGSEASNKGCVRPSRSRTCDGRHSGPSTRGSTRKSGGAETSHRSCSTQSCCARRPRSGSMRSSPRWRARTVESSSSGSSGKGRRPKCYPRWAGPRSHIRYGAKTVANQGSNVATIVVGVDGTDSARQAARFALEEARLSHAQSTPGARS